MLMFLMAILCYGSLLGMVALGLFEVLYSDPECDCDDCELLAFYEEMRGHKWIK